ncbi:MAG: hypothetical protein EPO51_08390 [Phenylobacterium sp.]|uniref:TniB family NTP-binding protein n=1 Tax=Phenylobacterium sp. TaxID=1871053 RepID=UPI001209EF2B|nr:TniB family NTP-binding protein [Phenylobacterium sp.]TAJ72125.1 MAG: hypothetical protein EPO51_08390 [Phenylobacterium sp.]
MSAQNVAEAARRLAAADAIVVDNPRARAAHRTFDFMRESRRQGSDRGTRGFLMVAPPQTGKSTILSSYLARANTEEALAEGRIPVLMVTLTANQTRKGLSQDILRALAPFGYLAPWKSGTESVLLDRVATYIRRCQVELLILDEFHHLVHSDKLEVNSSVSEMVKWLLIEAVAPIVMSGIDDAWKPVRGNVQLARRCEPPLELHQLDPSSAEDRKLFQEFLAAYLVELEDRDIAKNATNLLHMDGVPDGLFSVAKGVLGETCNLLKSALHLALQDGREEITHADLELATDMNYVAFKPGTSNPFKVGLPALAPAKLSRSARP